MVEQNPDKALGHVYLMDAHGAAQALDVSDIKQIRAHDKGIWVHMAYDHEDELATIAELFNLDDVVMDALMAESTRPRAIPHNNGLLMALRGINLNPGAEPEDMVSIRVWVDEHIMVSTSKRKLRSVDDLCSQFEQGHGALNTADLMVALIDRLVWHMSEFVDDMEDDIAGLEESILEKSGDHLRLELSMLRRKAIVARRHLAPQREALGRLLSERVDWMSNESRIQLREINDRLIRHIEDIDTVRERSAITHEELNSRHSERLNAKMYLLSIVTTIFLPLSFLTGLLGINVAGIPGAEHPHAFTIFTGMLLALVVLLSVFFRWKKWL